MIKANHHRPSWDDYFMKLAQLVATRSTCIRTGRKVGAVLVAQKHILSTGFNGAPTGMAHCEEVGCVRDQLKIPSGTRHEICRAVHAEQNAIIQCALHEVSSKNSTIYVTHQPCAICTKILINAQVRRIVYQHPYPDKFAQNMIKEAGIKLEQWQLKENK
ncbi:MAG: cytidine/deoxycytidylate deaminase family protein [Candidatus Shapirobacteria bacterium]|nr:cytidine/deoxycytidylate deaminase family protein [Candidatus Shapirobacteria bacterium]